MIYVGAVTFGGGVTGVIFVGGVVFVYTMDLEPMVFRTHDSVIVSISPRPDHSDTEGGGRIL